MKVILRVFKIQYSLSIFVIHHVMIDSNYTASTVFLLRVLFYVELSGTAKMNHTNTISSYRM